MTASAAVAIERAAPVPESAEAGPALVNLQNVSADLACHLVACAERGDTLNAFLLAAGLQQIAEDVLEGSWPLAADAQRVLASGGHPLAAQGVAAAASALPRRPRGAAALRAHAAAAGSLVDDLADALVAGGAHAPDPPRLVERARALRDRLPSVPALQARALRLPACFRGFDQHPDDVARLAEAFAAARPARDVPVAVVGVRTSGSYLAPLTAACLRALGYSGAFAVSARPWHRLDAGKRRRLRAVARAGGAVIVTDDPPASGESMLQVVRATEALGASPHSAVPMFAMHAGSREPVVLGDYECVTLPWERWSIHERLEPAAIARSLARLWPGVRIGEVTRMPLADEPGRGHVAARYSVTVEAPLRETRELFVRGVGLGYFGDHAMAVSCRLDEWLPPLHGVVDGLAFRDWIGEDESVAPGPGEVARYAAERARRLPLERDTSAALGGQDPVWEVASNILSRAFARGWRVARVGALDSIARELLAPERPSVIDGRMHPAAWYSGPVKTKADEGAYSNRNLACCDAAYDVAAAVALGDLDPEQVKAEYARVSGHAIDEERWLAYQLVAAWAARRDGLFDEAGERRASTRALRHYFARRFLCDVPRGAGGFCALDVDGVLETETLGFPALSPAGALALRALRAHGHRPLLASGRSAGEIRDRCIDYGLAGGVAEYGAAVFHAARDEVEVLVTPAGAAALERARAVLAGRSGVELGSEHVHTIRAWRRDDRGRPGPLREDDMRAALEAAGEGTLRTVPGESQTDIVPAEVDKARGLRALTERLGAAGAPIELAVGDAVEDLPMLALGRIAMAPANADAAVRAGHIRIARRGHQAGLAVAVAELVGHAPGACPACAPPPADRRAELVLGILAAREGGRARLAAQALRTAWLARGRRAAR